MQQIRRSFNSIIARASLATAAMAAGGGAMAADISWSVGIGSPGYQVVVSHAPPVVMHHPVVVVQQPRMRMRMHRPVVMHVAQPQVIYSRAPVFVQDHGHGRVHARDGGRHGYKHWNNDRPRYYRHNERQHRPGFDGNWGNN